MWIKAVDGGYYNMLTGTNVEVRYSNNGGDFRVFVVQGTVPQICLQKGFRSKEDAVYALDETMSSQELVTIDVPDYDEEDEEGDESEEDDESETESADGYSAMSNEDLKSAIAARNESRVAEGLDPLSTTGNKKALTARLREDDAALANA